MPIRTSWAGVIRDIVSHCRPSYTLFTILEIAVSSLHHLFTPDSLLSLDLNG